MQTKIKGLEKVLFTKACHGSDFGSSVIRMSVNPKSNRSERIGFLFLSDPIGSDIGLSDSIRNLNAQISARQLSNKLIRQGYLFGFFNIENQVKT